MITTTLDCGHEPTPSAGIGTGYATTVDGKTSCYGCAEAQERTEFARADRYTAYVSADGRHLTTWTGAILARVTRLHTSKRAHKTYVNATDILTGTEWTGVGPLDNGTYVNLRRTK